MGVTPIVFDLETAPLENAQEYLEPVQPDKRLKDTDKIKADVEQKTADRNDRCSLDYNVGRIVALGWWTEEQGTEIRCCQTEEDEAAALTEFWEESRGRTLVGFACKQFDMRFLVQRSRYLRVPHPILDFSKYSRRGVTDLFIDLTFGDGTYDQGAMRRTLHAFCKRFGIPVQDGIKGAEIPALVAAGDWEQVSAHCRSDVELTLALARRLGIVAADPMLAEQEPMLPGVV